MRGIWNLIGRFRRDERGAFLVLFGVMAIVLVAAAGAAVDYATVEQARSRAQEALDYAALGLQPTLNRTPAPTTDQLKSRAQDLIQERLDDATITALVSEANVDAENTLTLQARITVPTAFVSLVGVGSITANLLSEVKKGGVNIEVAVALDATGSMAGQRIVDLRAATNELIDLVVQDQQTPFYSKMALVPYSMGVNVGSYANAIRGGIAGGTSITAADWRVSGSNGTINAITQDDPARVQTSSNHGYSTGDIVYISGVNGMTQINGGPYVITVVHNRRFTLDGVNSSSWPSFSSTGSPTVWRCLNSACEVRITSNGHGFNNGDEVYITGIGTMTQANNTSANPVWTVKERTNNTFQIGLVAPNQNAGSGGNVFCTAPGCQYYAFQSAPGRLPVWPSTWYGGGQKNLFPITTCVSERTGVNAYTDAPPSTALFGRNYSPTTLSQHYQNANYNPCIGQTITPLSTNRTALKAQVNALQAGGSTGGHIGLAWTWYMLSPNFGYIWPSGSQPAAYGEDKLVKVAVLMTDGEFNSVYCNGVIAKNSISGSGTPLYHNDCNAPNGDSYHQANQICDAMKATGILVYTVGFLIVDQQEARDLMADCATSPQHAFLAESGSELMDAFRAIGSSIASLRVSR